MSLLNVLEKLTSESDDVNSSPKQTSAPLQAQVVRGSLDTKELEKRYYELFNNKQLI